jgi:RND family efflux transporter MFP subunit
MSITVTPTTRILGSLTPGFQVRSHAHACTHRQGAAVTVTGMPRSIVLLPFLFALLSGCKRVEDPEPLRIGLVEMRDIVVSASAAGTIAPITTIDVKSQASGEITEVHVDEGDEVKRGQLLVRVDPRIPENAVRQAMADSVVASAALENAESALRRAEQLYKEQALTQAELENARLAHATVLAQLVSAQRVLEDARIAFVQTEVRAPSAGVILSRAVEVGSVIASASRDVGGGAILLRMASLDMVEVRSLVDESDIGRIKPGLPARIRVDAFPNRHFEGEVLRIGAEAVLEQNVTTFPVLVRIRNRERLLKPGMNADVDVRISELENTLAVPNSALRDRSDVASASDLVGVPADSLEAQLRALEMGDRDLVAFTIRNGIVRVTPVRVGITDFDYSAVESGLALGDSVVILPTAGLLADQARRQEWVQRRVGDGPLGGR